MAGWKQLFCIYGKLILIKTGGGRDRKSLCQELIPPVWGTCTLSEGLVLFLFNEYNLTSLSGVTSLIRVLLMNTTTAFLELTFDKDRCWLEGLAIWPLSIKHITQVTAVLLDKRHTI